MSRLIQTIRNRPGWSQPAITVIKSVHTVIFLFMAFCAFHVLYSGLVGDFSWLTRISIAVIAFEAVVLLMNRGRCPLTILVEELGCEHGSVSDIFLPTWFTPRIPVVFTTMFVLGLAGLGLHHLM